jgi:hypothetical protein
MMTVYQLKGDVEDYQWLTMVNEEDFQIAVEMDGKSVASAWRAYPVKVIDDELNAGALPSDCPTLGIIPTFSQRAVEVLRDILEAHGEILPLSAETGRYHAYNVTRVVDALDEQKSEIVRFSDGDVMRVARYEFLPDRLYKIPIFKVPQLRAQVFVTEEFVRRVEDAGLVGFDFRRLWPKEDVMR